MRDRPVKVTQYGRLLFRVTYERANEYVRGGFARWLNKRSDCIEIKSVCIQLPQPWRAHYTDLASGVPRTMLKRVLDTGEYVEWDDRKGWGQ